MTCMCSDYPMEVRVLPVAPMARKAIHCDVLEEHLSGLQRGLECRQGMVIV
jgi:hypothetical protein